MVRPPPASGSRPPASRSRAGRCAAPLLAALAACAPTSRPAPLRHEAYVWQRAWTAPVAEAVGEAPRALRALRVLAVERSGPGRALVRVGVDLPALARGGRPVVAVLRVDGAAPLDGLGLDEVVEEARRWRAGGIAVRGVEVDHDCATARLPAYAAWLRAGRERLGDLSLTITALPAWTSGELGPLLAAVDGVTLQVHAARAPSLFDAAEARGWLERWAAAARRPFAVALPTYRARLATGQELSAEPEEVARFLRGLERAPVDGLTAVAWFRLGNGADPDAWSGRTLAAVIGGAPLRPALTARLVPGSGGALDIVLENQGEVDAAAPARLQLRGAIEALDGVRGYSVAGDSLFARAPPRLRAGERFTIGWARGREVTLASP